MQLIETIEHHLDEERAHWGLWFAVATLLGIVTYFALSHEPAYPQEPLVILLVAVLLGALGWGRQGHGQVALLFGSLLTSGVALGMGVAAMHSHGHESSLLLTEPLSFQPLVARVHRLEPSKNGVRLTLHEVRAPDGLSLPNVRMTVRGTVDDYPVGSLIATMGNLYPPRAPAWQGDFDGVRHAWFQAIGGYGYALGKAKVLERGEDDEGINPLRIAIDARIKEVIDAPASLVASALLTGYRHALPDELWKSMRGSGLAHLLAISGLHMALISGTLFFMLRLFFALLPPLVLNYSVKKWAALLAIGGGFFYLLLTGGTTPTMRAFIMVFLFFVGVMMARRVYTLAMVAWAAVALMVMSPERVLSSGFQMSFIAVIALVAFFHHIVKQTSWNDEELPWYRRVVWLRYMQAVALSSVIAGLVTTPFVAYHFHVVPLYGVFANLLAVPLTAFWIMPSGLLAVLFMPLQWDAPFLWMMGKGIEWLIVIADDVYGWRGSVVSVGSFPVMALLLWSVGLFWLCFWHHHRRWGFAVMAVSVVMMFDTTPPVLLVADDGSAVIVNQTQTGNVMIPMSEVHDDFRMASWQKALAARLMTSEQLMARDDILRCDRDACIWHDTRISNLGIAFIHRPEAWREECRHSDIIVMVTGGAPHGACAAHVIDNKALQTHGSHSVWHDGESWRVKVMPSGRLWHTSFWHSPLEHQR